MWMLKHLVSCIGRRQADILTSPVISFMFQKAKISLISHTFVVHCSTRGLDRAHLRLDIGIWPAQRSMSDYLRLSSPSETFSHSLSVLM